jgi:hypothetical protein
MSTLATCDVKQAIKGQLPPPGVKVVPMGSFKVEKIGSLDDFKAKTIGMGQLRPAIMTSTGLWVHNGRSQQ